MFVCCFNKNLFFYKVRFLFTFSAKGIAYGGYDNDKTRFRVFNTGTVRWIIPLHLTTTCDVDISRFPFDSQFCYIEIIFWALNFIDVTANISSEVRFKDILIHNQWERRRMIIFIVISLGRCFPQKPLQNFIKMAIQIKAKDDIQTARLTTLPFIQV